MEKAIQVLLPVHNEGDCIERVVKEIYEEISSRIPMEFIICEDGSTDNTKEVLHELANAYPMRLVSGQERKGYSNAVRDGMRALDAPFLLCLDSDGQCDPKDFWCFWQERDRFDVLIGRRTNRADPLVRKLFSRIFFAIYKLFFPIKIHDPSCPYILIRKPNAEQLVDELGKMQQGFWWEFMARVYRHHWTYMELPVNHRQRIAGTTQVYKFSKMPKIFIQHFLALFEIWFETRNVPPIRESADATPQT